MRIGFFTSLNTNVGDDFIREGIRAALDRCGFAYEPLYVNKVARHTLHDPAADEVQVARNKFWDSDIFIQAGAPVYWNIPPHTSLTSEWHNWFWEELVFAPPSDPRPVFLNIGAGSCQRWGEGAESFLADPACVAFARKAAAQSRLTTTRDPLASEILKRLEIPHETLPCPAFLAASRYQFGPPVPGLVGVNLMPRSTHFDFDGNFDDRAWLNTVVQLLARLRRDAELCFICHDQAEADFARLFASGAERIFQAGSWREYLDVYARCEMVVANRVHGAVCAAGCGVPSVIIGNDSRVGIGEFIELPTFRSVGLDVAAVTAACERLRRGRAAESKRLLDLRAATLDRYGRLLRPILASVASRPRVRRPEPPIALASVAELESSVYRGFMAELNAFAAEHGLRQFTDWSKVWEYPWLWFHGLGALDWKGTTVLDLGSELSPLPWYLAVRGARVHLVEADPQWQPTWIALKQKLGVDVKWDIVSTETLPLPDASCDVVTSLSVIEHQPDKARAVGEVVRVLRPGGTFAVSFDICEPALGMTFPSWNGSALTLADFESVIWAHPAWGSPDKPRWNTVDMEAFREWNLRSAPHHNYVVGAALLRKRA